MTKKKDNSNSISSTDQFYHSCIDGLNDTDTYSNRENDERYRPLLIEHLKNTIAKGKFKVSRDEVLKIIKKAAEDIKEDTDIDIKKND
ncbi:MAG: hypothetical protein KAR20_28945 [Candidatus Heimdallarchaeota archaeon]|nr:hypothetical protein [Candidatus Heimdallarchaeota archaeon]